MALPTSGTITVSEIQTEFSASSLEDAAIEASVSLPASATDFYGLAAFGGFNTVNSVQDSNTASSTAIIRIYGGDYASNVCGQVRYGTSTSFTIHDSFNLATDRNHPDWEMRMVLIDSFGNSVNTVSAGTWTKGYYQIYASNSGGTAYVQADIYMRNSTLGIGSSLIGRFEGRHTS